MLLDGVVPADRILTDPDTVVPYLHDEAEWAAYARPLAVARPRSTAEVAAVVAACAAERVPVVPRGVGTGLSGGANAVAGCVVLAACGATVAGVTARGLQPAAFELVDRHCLRAVNDWKNAGLRTDAAALLLAQSDLPEPTAALEAEAMHAEFVAAGARDAMVSTDAAEAEALFDARRLAYPALEQRGDAILTEDVCLPRGRLAGMLARVEEIAQRHDTLIANLAHAGDGNLHPLLITPPGDAAARARAQAAFAEIVDAAIDLGGTVTGEHGVGLLKRDGMRRELGPAVLAMQRAVKQALDPHGILNPDKVIG